MSSISRSLTVALIALALVACAGQVAKFPIASLDREGFHHASYDYTVLPESNSGGLMSRDWRLDNFVPAEEGLGAPKEGDQFVTEVSLDHDGDGEYEARVKLPIFDLLFKHRRNDGQLFLSTMPISQYDSERELSVMLRDLVGRASHGGRVSYDFDRGTGRASGEMASRILTTRPVTVNGYPAHEVIFEVANVQQLELSPDARWVRSHLVLVRTDFVFSRDQMGPAFRVPTLGGRSWAGATFYPVLMIIGYSNHPDDFDAHHPEFRDFLSRVRLSGTWPLDGFEAERARCELEQLDVIVSSGLVFQSSLVHGSDEGRCASPGLLAITVPDSPWRRTFSVRARPLRVGNATTAGGPLEAVAQDATTSGGETPVPAPSTSPVAP